MTGSMVTRLATRTLGRNVRRTILSVLGIAVGCAVALFMTAFMRAGMELRVRAIAQSGFGHLRLAPAGWEESRDEDLRLTDWRAALAAARQAPGVAVAAPHARTTGLLAFGTEVMGAQVLGVDPEAEAGYNRLIRSLAQGRYLQPGERGAVVVGRTMATRLDVELDDPLMLTVVGAGGDMEYAMLRIVGIAETGSREIDAGICHVTIEEAMALTGRDGVAEITIAVEDAAALDEVARGLAAQVPPGNQVLTWREVIPEQGGDARSDRAFMNMLVGIVMVMVVLGVTSAQLTAMLERRREFAVLLALGMRGIQVLRLVALEAVTLGAVGAAAGLVLALPLVYHTATTGINFAEMMGGEMAIGGVLFDPVFYADMGWWMVPQALVLSLVSALVASVYPALYALRTNPTSALSLRP